MKRYITSKITSLMLLVLTTLGVINESAAQQDSQYTMYMYNTANVNPAYAGSRETITAFLLHYFYELHNNIIIYFRVFCQPFYNFPH